MLSQLHRYQQSTPAQRAIAQRFRSGGTEPAFAAPQRNRLLSGGQQTQKLDYPQLSEYRSFVLRSRIFLLLMVDRPLAEPHCHGRK